MAELIVPLDKLRAADVFLYHGNSLIGRGIRLFDGTEVNHAGLYLGPPPTDKVTEALGDGVRTRTRVESVKDSEYVLAFRHKTAPDQPELVTAVAGKIVEQHVKYGYEQIVLLAILALTRRAPVNGLFAAFLRKVLDAAAGKLAALVEDGIGRKSMICSEVVFRCYDDALPALRDPFTIEIEGLNVFPGGVPAPFGPTQPRRLRRPEPGSVLDLLGSPAGGAFGPTPLEEAKALPAPDAAAQGRLDAEADRAIQEYLDALLEPERRLAAFAPLLAEPELQQSIREFATVFQLASEGTPAQQTFSVASALDRLRRDAAQFVTPGDLYKSRSLMRLGRVPRDA